jgi:hypothetical protein
MQFFPTFSKTPEEKAGLRAIRLRELRIYRRYPSFILGLALLLASWFVAFFVVRGLLGAFIALAGAAGFALVHDTVTLHLLRTIQRAENQHESSPRDDSKA